MNLGNKISKIKEEYDLQPSTSNHKTMTKYNSFVKNKNSEDLYDEKIDSKLHFSPIYGSESTNLITPHSHCEPSPLNIQGKFINLLTKI